MTEFLVLGPVQIRAGDQHIQLLQPRQHHVLAALLVDLNRPVSWAKLVDRVWGTHPPDTARTAIRAHVSRIRQALRAAGELSGRPGLLVRGGGGYEMRADPVQVDLHQLRGLAERARTVQDDPAVRVALLRQAVALWRGEPLAGLTGDWVGRVRSAWQHERLDVVAAWAAAELELGNPAPVLSALADLAEEHPLVEPVAAVHIRALHAVGRTAEAIDRFMRIRDRLSDELGIAPGAELRRAHQIVVRETPSTRTAAAPERPTVRVHLPFDVHGFVGRRAELTTLDSPAPIAVVRGPAGVGKTALAVHWAHRAAARFLDGRLYLNLRGFDPVEQAVDPAAALRRLLLALDVPARRIPADPDAAAAAYRTALTGRRMLIILDNARDETQVRPLLPGPSGGQVVVTSRDDLAGLVAEGAVPVGLGALSTDEAAQLLGRRLGPDRLVGEWQAVTGIIERCARLPLALTVAAARAASTPQVPLSTLAAELGPARHRRDDLRVVLDHSYRSLSGPARRMFRLLGLHPGTDIAAPAAASLVALPLPETATLLAELTGAALLTEHFPGRYAYHDLLRAYVPDADQRPALIRVLDHYLHTAHAADRRLYPGHDPVTVDPPAAGTTPSTFADDRQATEWFAAERTTVLAAVDRAAASGLDLHAWRLAGTLRTHLARRGLWAELAAVTQTALAAAVRLGDMSMQARTHHQLGSTSTRLHRFTDAERELTLALAQYGTIGDLAGQARAHRHLGHLFERREQPARALDHASRALELYRKAGHRDGEAHALKGIGWHSARLGLHSRALAAFQEALDLFKELGDRPGEATTWDSVGNIHHGLGDDAAAIVDYRRALALFRDLGNRYHEAGTLTHLGDVQAATGDTQAAHDAWRRALTILTDLRHTDATRVRARLAG
ncbi:MAG: BTAD domain-containing putative transcriptional regulator [Actinoplanes sp.]